MFANGEVDESIFFGKFKDMWLLTIGMRTDRKWVHLCKKMSNMPRKGNGSLAAKEHGVMTL